jgi:hypothetical protein
MSVKSVGIPNKYLPENQHWYDDDLMKDCPKPVVTCKCGHKGHPTIHLNQNVKDNNGNVQLIKRIAHSHFTHETDRGRHVACEYSRVFADPDQVCESYLRLKTKNNLPEWIRGELYS